MTDDDKALDKIIRASMPLDFERKETLSDDKTLVKRLRWSASGKVGAEQARLERNAADRIETLNAMLKAAEESLGDQLAARKEQADRIEAQAAEIERLREALGWYAEDNHWRYIPAAGCSCVDADGGDVARAALEETLHVPETCKENGESFT